MEIHLKTKVFGIWTKTATLHLPESQVMEEAALGDTQEQNKIDFTKIIQPIIKHTSREQ